MQPARYTVSSRDIDDEHRPRIVRCTPVVPVQRSRPSPVISALLQFKVGILLCTALAGPALFFLISALRWESPEIASAPAPKSVSLSSSGSLVAEAAMLALPAVPSATAPDPTLSSIGTSARTLDGQLALEGATDRPTAGASLPPADGLGAAKDEGAPQPLTANEGSPSAGTASAGSRRSPSPAAPRSAGPRASHHSQIVVQLSSFSDRAKAREGVSKLERSLRSA